MICEKLSYLLRMHLHFSGIFSHFVCCVLMAEKKENVTEITLHLT